MANSYDTNPVVLDTFSSAIDLCASIGLTTNTPIALEFIKWATPTTAGDTCEILDGVGGIPIFSETCAVSKQSVINYFHGEQVKNLYVTASAVSTGKIFILLSKNKGD